MRHRLDLAEAMLRERAHLSNIDGIRQEVMDEFEIVLTQMPYVGGAASRMSDFFMRLIGFMAIVEKLAKGGDVSLFHDGAEVGKGRVEITQPMVFSADETTDIGYESGTTVTPDYTASTSRFTGRINWVQIDLGDDDNDHFIDPDERLRVAMARQ